MFYNTENKQQAIRSALAERAEGMVTEVKRCHILGDSYDWVRVYEQAYCEDAENIRAWEDLRTDIDHAESELDRTPYCMDRETGCPCGRYDDLYQHLCDLREDAEEWASLYETEYNKLWDALEMALYPEEG